MALPAADLYETTPFDQMFLRGWRPAVGPTLWPRVLESAGLDDERALSLIAPAYADGEFDPDVFELQCEVLRASTAYTEAMLDYRGL
jgi:hypothetical protein